jgi:hypothetical protein
VVAAARAAGADQPEPPELPASPGPPELPEPSGSPEPLAAGSAADRR